MRVFKGQLLAHDRRTLTQMAQVYQPIQQDLVTRIKALEKDLADLDTYTEGKAKRLERYQDLLEQVDTQLGRFRRPGQMMLLNAQGTAVKLAQNHALGLAGVQDARVMAGWNRLNTAALENIVGRMGNGASLERYFDDLTSQTAAILRQELQSGVALGLNPRLVAGRLEDLVNYSAVRLESAARNEMLGAYRAAALQNYADNADVLDGWAWHSALDKTTCPACLTLHGREFPLTEQFMKTHGRCRCSPIPLVKGYGNPFAGQGEAYFAKLTPDKQDKHLRYSGGSASGDAYREGKVTLADFLTLRKNEEWGDRYEAFRSLTDVETAATLRIAAMPKAKRATKPKATPTDPAAPNHKARAKEIRAIDQDYFETKDELSAWIIDQTPTIERSGSNNALYNYFGEDYKRINRKARKGDAPEADAEVAAIDRAIASVGTPTPLKLYRGVSGEGSTAAMLRGVKPGDVIADRGFVSTSLDEDVATRFASRGEDFVLEMYAPLGTKGLYAEPWADFDEAELLLGRNTPMIVREVIPSKTGKKPTRLIVEIVA